jgi:hypothetical protein
MLHHVALVRTDVSEECVASIIRVTRIGELGTLAVISNEYSSEMLVFTRATWHNIPEDRILHCHRHENLKSYTIKLCFAYHVLDST